MKKSFLVLMLIVSIMVLGAPILVSASSSGTTVITGHQGTILELTAPSAISFGNFTLGVNSGSSTTPGSVATNATTWSVTAIDQNTADHIGCMLSGSNYLGGAFQISKDGSDYTSANNYITYNNPTTLPFYVKQNVQATDKAGDYSITIVFTASGS